MVHSKEKMGLGHIATVQIAQERVYKDVSQAPSNIVGGVVFLLSRIDKRYVHEPAC
jgi:hypothetical protein